MTSDQTGRRVAGAWLAGASLLLVLALGFHGPLHPDLEVQMTRIGESASRWAAVHWTAAAAFSCFAIAAVLVLVSRSRLTSTGKTISALGGGLGRGALDADDGRHRGHRNSGPRGVQEPCPVRSVVVLRGGVRERLLNARGGGGGHCLERVPGSTSAPSEMVGGSRCRSRTRVIRRLGARSLARRWPREPLVAPCVGGDVRLACLLWYRARQNERHQWSGGAKLTRGEQTCRSSVRPNKPMNLTVAFGARRLSARR